MAIAYSATKVFVGNVPSDVKDLELQRHFKKAGRVIGLRVARDPENGDQCKGFAFVEYADKQGAANAIRLFDGKEFGQVWLAVEYAKVSNSSPPSTPPPSATKRSHTSPPRLQLQPKQEVKVAPTSKPAVEKSSALATLTVLRQLPMTSVSLMAMTMPGFKADLQQVLLAAAVAQSAEHAAADPVSLLFSTATVGAGRTYSLFGGAEL